MADSSQRKGKPSRWNCPEGKVSRPAIGWRQRGGYRSADATAYYSARGGRRVARDGPDVCRHDPRVLPDLLKTEVPRFGGAPRRATRALRQTALQVERPEGLPRGLPLIPSSTTDIRLETPLFAMARERDIMYDNAPKTRGFRAFGKQRLGPMTRWRSQVRALYRPLCTPLAAVASGVVVVTESALTQATDKTPRFGRVVRRSSRTTTIAASVYKREYKRSRYRFSVIRACRLQAFGLRLDIQRQRRQCVQGAGHVQQFWIGVDVGGQGRRAVPHGGLCCSQRHAATAQVRPEGMPHGVNIDGPAALVALGNARRRQVTIQDAHQARRDVKQRRSRRQSQRHRLADPQAADRGNTSALADVPLAGLLCSCAKESPQWLPTSVGGW